ncbi:MFS transporter [Rhodococcus sp. BP-349]|uniref:MFS transporter n=1 Tax=unclassified Rhodococcus (in: high G+C Gram-positive bacteria) TaxID=192944 RepID=UPI001C9AE1EF|nr:MULTISPECIES: MFS transporter [unclassified Rhodococcus (in: high G+C Gram-positive bacteria)]MBY6538266.1 MFS transporter [Rhodococcus sp. BP-363]MBY6542603.1 MFS transporter [Rhodococcus sp. BP-369]MBY6561833.1 MFS transporter [Rhodococcus sp. BP-370]MBY6576125.1 MFS transporter [Rhodococcus sp. BP-364]MBY6585426.1 MFS transporter [Rhodococcus sp. BP-358]
MTSDSDAAVQITRPRRVHRAWIVAAVAFLALLGAAGFRAAPSVLMVPITDEFGWSRGVLSAAVGINLLLFGLTAPFAAALMDRFGIRTVTSVALTVVALGSALTVFVTAPWQILLTWGLLIGLGTGSMALVFAAMVTDRWFVRRRGLVSGILTAGSATGQLIFLPVVAALADSSGWRTASLVVAGGALAVVPFVLLFLRNSPEEVGELPYGATERPAPVLVTGNPAMRAIRALRDASSVRTFWALMVGFAICGATTNGLVGVHFIPSAHDHGMPQTTAAGLLAVVGIFDIVGTIASGWLTDRVDPRLLLGAYYAFRGVALLFLPALLSDALHPSIVVFIVVYGLDWVATVPPTIALCREVFGAQGPLVFGWVFASHQVGAGIASVVAGVVRDATGEYTAAWFGAAGLCVVAAVLSVGIARRSAPVTG